MTHWLDGASANVTTHALDLDPTVRVEIKLYQQPTSGILARFHFPRLRDTVDIAHGLICVVFRATPAQCFLDDPTPIKLRRAIVLPDNASEALGACMLAGDGPCLSAAAWMILRIGRDALG